MPKYHKKNLLSSPLDIPELPDGHELMKSEIDHRFDPVQTLLTWKAPSRPFRKKSRGFYTQVALFIIVLCGIAFFAQYFLLIGVLLSFGFLVYVLNYVEPQDAEYKLSTQGVTIDDHFYHWDELNSFWFSEKDDYKILNILTNIRFPGVLMLVMGSTSEETIKNICARYLPFHEIAPKSIMDKWSDSLQKHLQLEKHP